MSHLARNTSSEKVAFVSLNEDKSCFLFSCDSGLHVFNVDPLRFISSINVSDVGTLSNAWLLDKTNLIAMISGGTNPKFANNTVMIWDDCAKKFVLEYGFRFPVVSVNIQNDCLCAILPTQIAIFAFPNASRHVQTLPTYDNPIGLCSISCHAHIRMIAYPGTKPGSVQISEVTLPPVRRGSSSSGGSGTAAAVEPDLPRHTSVPVSLEAHRSRLSGVALSPDGRLLATASTKGTLVRLFSVATKRKVAEFRRGMDTALIYNLAFSPSARLLCLSSDKGTVHVWSVDKPELNRDSALLKQVGFLSSGFGFVECMYAMTSFTVPAEVPCHCAFSADNTVIAICMDGSFQKYSLSPSDGACHRQSYDVFVDMVDDRAV